MAQVRLLTRVHSKTRNFQLYQGLAFVFTDDARLKLELKVETACINIVCCGEPRPATSLLWSALDAVISLLCERFHIELAMDALCPLCIGSNKSPLCSFPLNDSGSRITLSSVCSSMRRVRNETKRSATAPLSCKDVIWALDKSAFCLSVNRKVDEQLVLGDQRTPASRKASDDLQSAAFVAAPSSLLLEIKDAAIAAKDEEKAAKEAAIKAKEATEGKRSADELKAGLEVGEVGKKVKLLHHIESGGGGHVWCAVDAIDGKQCVVKFIEATTDALLNKAIHEPISQALVRGHSRFIVPTEVFVHGGWLVLLMPLYRCSLAKLLNPRDELALSKNALKWALQIGLAIVDIRRADLIHRDLKPGNVMLDDANNAFLSDFGMAKRQGPAAVQSSVVGSVGYVPPELAEPSIVRVDPNSHDLFSFGITLLQLLVPWTPSKETDEEALRQSVEKAWTEGKRSTSDEIYPLIIGLLQRTRSDNDLHKAIRFLHALLVDQLGPNGVCASRDSRDFLIMS